MLKYKNYLLTLLTLINAFNYVDRLALGLVLQDIKVELHLSDAQLGLLSGITFALFYSVMGIPIARWADRGNRVTIISLTAAVWSVLVALCGTATNFVQMVLIRVGVGVGEAGCVPPAHSLVADYFDRAERPRAMSFYLQGSNVSYLVGYFAAGWLSQLYGWRTMFVAIGLPGVALAVLAKLSLREPRLGKQTIAPTVGAATDFPPKPEAPSSRQPGVMEVFLTLKACASFRHLLYFFSLSSLFSFGILNWQPAFMIRSFGLKPAELGTWLAIVFGVPSIVGTYLGGEWATRRAANNESRQLKVLAIANAGVNGILWPAIYLAHNYYIAFALTALGCLGGALYAGPVFATIQTLVPPRMRAMSIAILFFCANLIGLGLGPLIVGLLSDALRPRFGEESLRYALLALCPGFFWASWHLWRAGQTVTRDLAASGQDSGATSADASPAIAFSRRS